MTSAQWCGLGNTDMRHFEKKSAPSPNGWSRHHIALTPRIREAWKWSLSILTFTDIASHGTSECFFPSVYIILFYILYLILYINLALYFFVLLCVLKDQETSYTIIKSKETEIVVDGLKPSSAYIFQIRARTSAGYGGFSRRFEFETSLYCKSQFLNQAL